MGEHFFDIDLCRRSLMFCTAAQVSLWNLASQQPLDKRRCSCAFSPGVQRCREGALHARTSMAFLWDRELYSQMSCTFHREGGREGAGGVGHRLSHQHLFTLCCSMVLSFWQTQKNIKSSDFKIYFSFNASIGCKESSLLIKVGKSQGVRRA